MSSSLDPDQALWFQTVCKRYQQRALGVKELIRSYENVMP